MYVIMLYMQANKTVCAYVCMYVFTSESMHALKFLDSMDFAWLHIIMQMLLLIGCFISK